MSEHCSNNDKDRKLGAEWEDKFCWWAAYYGKSFTQHQRNHNKGTEQGAAGWYQPGECVFGEWIFRPLPDITIWTHPGQHHEVKHKAPTNDGRFGIEVYRLDSLLRFMADTSQSVYYTIHDYSRTDGKYDPSDRLCDWLTCDVNTLYTHRSEPLLSPSYYNGVVCQNVPTYYWKKDLWNPLDALWTFGE